MEVGGPRRGASGEAGGAAPEESASGLGSRRLAPPRGTERAASAPARETPATSGASTSEEGGRNERSAALGAGLGVGRRAPAAARATPWSSALAPCQGQVSSCGDSRARARGGERSGGGSERKPEPGKSCPLAGCGHSARAGKRCSGLFLEDRERRSGGVSATVFV